MSIVADYANYQIAENPYQRPTHPLVVVISGPSGVGKDTVVQALLRRSGNFYFVVTATSRPPRPGEQHGVDYFFVSETHFRRMIAEGEMLEHAWVHDNFKGVPKQQIRDALASGRDVLMRVDPQGAATLKMLMPSALFIFLMAESEEAMAKRLHNRRADSDEAMQLRLAVARQEMQRIPEFDYCVINREGELDKTLAQIENIIEAARHRTDMEAVAI